VTRTSPQAADVASVAPTQAAISRSKAIMISSINCARGRSCRSPETTSGGRRSKFYASIVWTCANSNNQDRSGVRRHRTRVNRQNIVVRPPFRRPSRHHLRRGISKMGSILDVALDQNIVGKSGSWYTYGEPANGQGRENAKSSWKSTAISQTRFLPRFASIWPEVSKTDRRPPLPSKTNAYAAALRRWRASA